MDLISKEVKLFLIKYEKAMQETILQILVFI